MSLALAFPLPRMTVRFSLTHPARRDGPPPSRRMEELPSQPSAMIRRDSPVQPRHGQRSLHIPSRPLRDPSAAVSPSSCLTMSSSRRPPLSRGELRLPPVYPSSSHPCSPVTSSLPCASRRAHFVCRRASFRARRAHSRCPFACSCTRVARPVRTLLACCFAHAN